MHDAAARRLCVIVETCAVIAIGQVCHVLQLLGACCVYRHHGTQHRDCGAGLQHLQAPSIPRQTTILVGDKDGLFTKSLCRIAIAPPNVLQLSLPSKPFVCRLYIVRRLLFAALVFLEHLLDSIFLINDRINPGTSPEGLHEIIAFGIHCKQPRKHPSPKCSAVCLSVFLHFSFCLFLQFPTHNFDSSDGVNALAARSGAHISASVFAP